LDTIKLKFILSLRLISRKFNKIFSGNLFWGEILKSNFKEFLIGSFRLEKITNDNLLFELFKVWGYEFRNDLKVFIDIREKFLRNLYNLPVIKKDSILYRENLQNNENNWKIENLVNYYRSRLWGSKSGLQFTLGNVALDNEYIEYNKYSKSCFSYMNGDIKTDYNRINSIFSYFSLNND